MSAKPASSPIIASPATSRRSFLHKSSLAIAAAPLATTLAARAFAAGDDVIKIALVGCGGRGTGAADQALSTPCATKLVAVADAFRDKADDTLKNLSKSHKDKVDVPSDRIFDGFDGYKKAIDSGADLVILATPPGFRPVHFEYAVKQGRNVFMEKPVAVDGAGVRRVLAAAQEAKKKNLKVAVGLQRHHQVAYIEAIKRIQDGAIGDVLFMRAYWNGGGVWVRPRQEGQTELQYQMRNWYYFNWLCGDHIVEQHIHNLDVCNWVKGGFPVSAQGQGGRQVRTGKDHGEIYDHHFVEFTYEDGTVLLSQCRHIPGCWSSVSEHAHGTKGYANISGGSIEVAGGDKWLSKPEKGRPWPNPYQQEHDDLQGAIHNNQPYSEAEYGAMSTMTSILGRMATYSGVMLKMSDALNSPIELAPGLDQYTWETKPPVLPDAEGRYPIAVPGQTKVV